MAQIQVWLRLVMLVLSDAGIADLHELARSLIWFHLQCYKRLRWSLVIVQPLSKHDQTFAPKLLDMSKGNFFDFETEFVLVI